MSKKPAEAGFLFESNQPGLETNRICRHHSSG